MSGTRATWQAGQVHLTRASQDECLALADLAADQGLRAARNGDHQVAELFAGEAARFMEGALTIGGMQVQVLVQPVDPELVALARARGEPDPLPTAAATSDTVAHLDGAHYRCPDGCACVSIVCAGNSLALLRTVGAVPHGAAAGTPADLVAGGLLPMAGQAATPWSPSSLARTGPAPRQAAEPILDAIRKGTLK